MIFYFSGTGNSKWVAERIAEITHDEVINIAEAITKNEFRYTLKEGERIGWVLPVYSWGPAPVVCEFVRRWHVDGYTQNDYCYAVFVCGDEVGMAVPMFAKELGFVQLKAAFSVQMPNNYILLPGFDVDDKETECRKLRDAEERIADIGARVAQCSQCVDVVEGGMKWIKSKMIYPLFKKWGCMDKYFSVDESLCSRCGCCAKNCGTGNITIDDNGLPKWNGDCKMCLSCIHRCPKRAIEYGKQTEKKGRYFLK